MTHQRKTIRDEVVALLSAGNAIVPAGNVHKNRDQPLTVADLPAIVVYTLPEQSRSLDSTSTTLLRTLEVNVELHAAVKPDESTDDAIDAYCDQIEAALKADQSWGGTVTASDLKSTEWTKDDQGGEAPIGTLRLKYIATYAY